MLKNSVGNLFGEIYGKYDTKSPWKIAQKNNGNHGNSRHFQRIFAENTVFNHPKIASKNTEILGNCDIFGGFSRKIQY